MWVRHMDLACIQDRLAKDNCHEEVINSVLSNITANIRSFTYANESLEGLSVFLVLKNIGGCRIFKTINGNIVVDKLDSSYSESRELVCLGGWNVKKAYKLCFGGAKGVVIHEVCAKEIHKVLFVLVEPSNVKYAIGVEEENCPITITVDCASYKGLGYKDLKDVVMSSYKHSLKTQGKPYVLHTDPSFYVVSYSVD
jgi:hypothetical protein